MTGLLLGLPVEEISLFVGPKLIAKKIGNAEYTIRLLPIGGHVRFEVEGFRSTHILKKIAVILSGVIAMLLISATILGLDRSISYFCSGPLQVVSGAWSPLHRGSEFIRQSLDYARQTDFLTLVGAALAKWAAVQMLPFPTLWGGLVLLMIARSIFRWSDRTEQGIAIIGFLLLLAMFVSWLVAFVAVLIWG